MDDPERVRAAANAFRAEKAGGTGAAQEKNGEKAKERERPARASSTRTEERKQVYAGEKLE